MKGNIFSSNKKYTTVVILSGELYITKFISYFCLKTRNWPSDGWNFTYVRGQLGLETLYVKFDQPAKNINIEGLPENVVPLMKIKRSVKCTFPNGVSIPIC